MLKKRIFLYVTLQYVTAIGTLFADGWDINIGYKGPANENYETKILFNDRKYQLEAANKEGKRKIIIEKYGVNDQTKPLGPFVVLYRALGTKEYMEFTCQYKKRTPQINVRTNTGKKIKSITMETLVDSNGNANCRLTTSIIN